MAPKALTDCPENLREAIDWLIQVKQGGGIPRLSEALSKLFDNVVQDGEKALPSVPESDEPSARDVISKLQTFRSSFPKDSSNNNQNILHNICSAVESFLGYQPPGTYNGSGIVYGSASRLCDAVVSFLHRVFSDVRDNQPYVVGGALLSGLVSDLEKARWAGHHGFKSVIPKVASGLGEYNRKVKDSNDRVKRPISDIIAYVKSEGGELPPNIRDLNETNPSDPDVKAAEELAKECIGKGKDFGKAFTSKTHKHYMKDAFDDLNGSLRDKIHNARNSVGRETAMLKKWTSKQLDNYKAMVKLIKQAFRKLKVNINSRIRKEVTELAERLKGLVGNILVKLNRISVLLGKCTFDLGKWMTEANGIIDAALRLVQNIYDELDDPKKSKDKLDKAIEKVEEKLEERVKDLNIWKSTAENILALAGVNADKIYIDLVHENKTATIGKSITNITNANNDIIGANTKLGNHITELGDWKGAADTLLEGVILNTNQVRGSLDYTKQDGVVGKNIKAIGECNKEISDANNTLGREVESLGNWINKAANIHDKAQKMAEGAYDFLKKYKESKTGKREETELTKNIKIIEAANKNIVEVNKRLNDADIDLGQWKEAAERVLSTAVHKAVDVKNKLDPNQHDDKHKIGQKINNIKTARQGLEDAKNKLHGHLESLSDWKVEAESVIISAVRKAENVWKALDETKKEDKSLGKNIENIETAKKAIENANQSLGEEVGHLNNWHTAADKIVAAGKVKCEKILERVIKDGKTEGTQIGINTQALQKKAENLLDAYSTAHKNVKALESAVPNAIKDLETGMKEDLERLQREIVKNMKEHVGGMLLQIQGDVKKIKGQAGSLNGDGTWTVQGSGLEGINTKVEKYFKAFKGRAFQSYIVKGWLDDSILLHNGLLTTKLGWDDANNDHANLALAISGRLNVNYLYDAEDTGNDQSFITAMNKLKGKSKNSMKDKIQYVHDVCEAFAKVMDDKLKGTNSAISGIVSKVKGAFKSYGGGGGRTEDARKAIEKAANNCKCECGENCDKKTPEECARCQKPECIVSQIVEFTLCALSSVAQQVREELDSLFLSPEDGNIATFLDAAKAATDKLHNNLDEAGKEANKKNKTPPAASSSQDNEILKSVQGIEEKVKEGMKIKNNIPQDFEKIMENYKEKRDGKDVHKKDSQYKQLLKDIPQAMKPFEDMNAFTVEEGKEQLKTGQVIKAKEAVSKHLSTVEEELKEIAWFVSSDKQKPPSLKLLPDGQEGIQNLLKKLEEGLKDKALDNSNKCLDKIREVIGNLQKDEFSKTTGIEEAVRLIKSTLKELRKELRNEQDIHNKTAIVNALNNLQKEGLNTKEKWQPVGGQQVEALMKIHKDIKNLKINEFTRHPGIIGGAVDVITRELSQLQSDLRNHVTRRLADLKEKGLMHGGGNWENDGPKARGFENIKSEIKSQNAILPTQTQNIADAIYEIKGELMKIGFKLDHRGNPEDVIDLLKELAKMMGKSKDKYSVNLQRIYDEIHWQQNWPLITKPIEIHRANEAIKSELMRLQNELHDNVTIKLTTLKNYGLTNGVNWTDNNTNVRAFEDITNDIHGLQQGDLGKTSVITQHIGEIKNELDEQRNKLEREVTARLRDLQSKGLADGEWNLGSQKINGLTKITNGISDIKSTDVGDVRDKLSILRGVIKNAAKDLKDNLKLMKDNMIGDRLVKIRDDLQHLHITLVKGAIKDCKEFIERDADVFKQRCIDELTKYVEQELEAEENKLLAEARRQYVSTVREMLQVFAAKVETELEGLPGEIDDDLRKGFKGFMKNMADGTTDDISTAKGENINKLVNVKDRKDVSAVSSAFVKFFGPLSGYVNEEIIRAHKQNSAERNPPGTDEQTYSYKLFMIRDALTNLLTYLNDKKGYDHRLSDLLAALTNALNDLRPESFAKPSTRVLDGVVEGLRAFYAEFKHCYVSAYSGAECREADADKYAKAFLSMIPMTHNAFHNLAEKCGSNWRSNKICKLTGDGRDNGLGNYLTRCGYKVSTTDGLQEGELQNQFSGGAVHELFASPVADVSVKILIDGKSAENEISVVDLVALFHNMACRYLQACHLNIPSTPRYPCTVRDMLSWLSGLQYTPVADKLPDHCRALLDRKCDDNDTPNRDDTVMAQCITSLPYTIASSCAHSTSLLVTIQGHGRGFNLAAYPYSVDFANNRAQLYYPADPADLLDMLRQICCRATAETKGWRECHYGRRVPYSHWQCNTYDNQATDASHNCPPTSPLQSFLTDSCPNLLPHKLSVVDSAIECANCPSNLPGQQCLTPLGFWDLGLAASMRRTGKDLAKSLGRLCSDADACLFQLCRTLQLLCPTAPQSLGDVFSLFTQLLRMWDHESSRRAYSHHESYVTHLSDEAIDKLFPLWTQLHGSYRNANLTDALQALASHEHENSGHDALSSLSAEPPCQQQYICAPFLQPLSLHANHTFPQKHAQICLTWVVHLAWQFWDLLQQLRDAFNNIDCTAHGCATCLCPPGNHGHKDACHCPSLVECGGPLPTLYRYGFAYRNAHVLVAGSQKIRCSDLNGQLTKILHSNHFRELFHQNDQLIWHIRMPFLFTLIALWLIATLYILHSLLYRMDVLRIRSHLLTTRASHLIDVKALLAGSRRMLSLYKDVDYFDDDFIS
ncbi:Extracellular matrix-binding ebh [Babesia ovata]|uniref:Extracellular matrix-binding ebh n=1 Tax=Babesia ovata TaxID=189622 RepID=A0A2H6KB57_9APIC|nr:Extracellular matrix-binding ebh [Babesia ovata]GBE60224.1 Extracellular matrix-binding ebh [Babesia ovata]